MSGTTPNLGLPFVEPSDAIADYPALDETRAGLLDRAGLVCIDDQVLAAAAPTIDFSAIPAGFAALQLVWQARSTAAAIAVNLTLRLNNDSAGNYDAFTGGLSSAGFLGYDTLAGPDGYLGEAAAASAPAGVAAVGQLHFPNYDGSTFHKLWFAESYNVQNTSANGLRRGVVGARWRNTAPVTRITLLPGAAGASFAIGSRATLYGLGVVGG